MWLITYITFIHYADAFIQSVLQVMYNKKNVKDDNRITPPSPENY